MKIEIKTVRERERMRDLLLWSKWGNGPYSQSLLKECKSVNFTECGLILQPFSFSGLNRGLSVWVA